MMTGSSYVPLARKWRPHSFSDVVGQDEIVRALSNAVESHRLAAAYLFAGPRGVGKTTSARLLAAAINCHSSDGPVSNPCGVCASCIEVFEGRSMDALEIDGATHGKVDQAREIIEMVAFAPARDRRRIIIIDEVHAISQAAFQALLKTLEEPPPHAVFILATTERHKIPATILSRCQRFDFRRLNDSEVADRLAEIATREGFVLDGGQESKSGSLVIEKDALSTIAAAATGSLRDGLSLLDQVAVRASGVITAHDVAALLGTPDRSALAGLLSLVLKGDRAAVLTEFARLESSGIEPRAALRDLTALCRSAVKLAAGLPPSSGLVSDAASQELSALSRRTPYSTLLRCLTLLSESEASLRRSDAPSLMLELVLLRLTELGELAAIEDILSGRTVVTLPPVAVREAENGSETEALPKDEGFSGLAPIETEPEPVQDPGAAFRAELEKRHAHLAAALEDTAIKIKGKQITLLVDPPNAVLEKRLSESSVKKVVEEAAAVVLGKGAKVKVEGAEPPGGDLVRAASTADPHVLEREHLRKKVEKDERVQKLLEMFGGEITEARRDDIER